MQVSISSNTSLPETQLPSNAGAAKSLNPPKRGFTTTDKVALVAVAIGLGAGVLSLATLAVGLVIPPAALIALPVGAVLCGVTFTAAAVAAVAFASEMSDAIISNALVRAEPKMGNTAPKEAEPKMEKTDWDKREALYTREIKFYEDLLKNANLDPKTRAECEIFLLSNKNELAKLQNDRPKPEEPKAQERISVSLSLGVRPPAPRPPIHRRHVPTRIRPIAMTPIKHEPTPLQIHMRQKQAEFFKT